MIQYLLKLVRKWTFFYETHISNVIGKLGVESRTQAIIALLKNGLINID